MHPSGIERHGYRELVLVSPRFRLCAALVIITFTVLLPRRPDILYLIPVVVILLVWPVCRMPLIYALRRLLVVEVFIVGIALLSLVDRSATPIFLSALLKSNLCVMTMLLLTWTTPFQDVLQELRRLRFPSVMLTTLALMYRYLPVLGEETRRMSRARASRTFSRSRVAIWHNLSLVIGRLFIRSADRAERIYLAMCARGWK
jgi:cobalt/nickel transport system permease protein